MGRKSRLKAQRRAQGGAPLVSIVIPVRDNVELTRACLESIARHTSESHEVIVVDNASADGTAAYLASVARRASNVRIVTNGQNLGFAAGCNQGMAASRGEHILLLNNDVVVTSGWLTRMLAAFDRDPAIGLVGPRASNVSGRQAVDVPPGFNLDDAAAFWATEHAGQGQEVDRLVGFCLLIRREVVNQIGGMDPRFGVGCFEDDDYCRRAKLAGFRLWQADDVLLHHVGSATFRAERIDMKRLLDANRQVFEAKWAETPDLFIPLGDSKPRPKPRISLCMIVRDEEEFLAGCLESVRGAVDEICIVDTGSTDRTIEIARQFGARVEHFTWVDDFSAARNASLDMATGDWILVLDADERLTSDAKKCIPVLIGESPDTHRAFDFQIHNPGAPGVSWIWGRRMFRRGFRYVGVLHELPVDPDTNLSAIGIPVPGCVVEHLGYSEEVWEARNKKARNLQVLRRAVAEGKADGYTLYQLARTDDTVLIAERLSLLESALRDRSHLYGYVVEAFELKAKLHILDCEVKAAGETAREGLSVTAESVDLNFILGCALHRQGNHDEALKAFIQAYLFAADGRRVYQGSLKARDILEEANHCARALGRPPVRLVPGVGSGATLHNDPYPELAAGCRVVRFASDTGPIKLTILIPTLPVHGAQFTRLLAEIRRQASGKPVEVLALVDAGSLTIGAKRNWLKANAAGEYIVFVDDDDLVTKNYVVSILKTLEDHPDADCVTFGVMRHIDGRPDRPAWYSKTFDHATLPDRYTSKPNHLMAFKAPIARLVDFPDVSWGDTAWANVVSAFIGKEVRIEGILYHYLNRGQTLANWPTMGASLQSRATVSLCMIVKNEEEFLGDCLASVKGVVDEIILVDTGSTDRTLEIAERYGAKIGFFQWRDDFAAARNFSLDMATGDWILVLDADERLKRESIPSLLHAISSPGAAHLDGWTLALRNIPEGPEDGLGAVTRVFRNKPSLRYQGALHERIVFKSVFDVASLTDVEILHLGYEPGLMAARDKRRRNLTILERQAEKGTATSADFIHLARISLNRGAEEEAESYYRKAIEAWIPATPFSNLDVEVAEAYCRLAKRLANTGRGQEAIQLANEGLGHFPWVPELLFVKGRMLFDQRRYPEALRAFANILKRDRRLVIRNNRIGDRDAVHGINMCLLALKRPTVKVAQGTNGQSVVTGLPKDLMGAEDRDVKPVSLDCLA